MAPALLAPADLVGPDGRPRALRIVGRTSDGLGLVQRGPTVPVSCAAFLSRLDGPGALTFLDGADHAGALAGVEGCAVVTRPELADLVPAGNAVLLAVPGERPRDAFYAAFADLVEAGAFETLAGGVDPCARVHPTAVLGPGVVVAAGAVVGPGVVIEGPAYVGPEVVIKPNAVVGTDGFEVMTRAGRRRILPHGGGVWLDEGAEIGGAACLDRGAFGEWTYVGRDAKVDNLVHVAHSVTLGAGVCVVAGAVVCGSSVVGDHAWIAPNAVVRQGVRIGEGTLVSLGAVVHKDLPAHVQAAGNPMRVLGHVCRCKAGLRWDDATPTRATCAACGTTFVRLSDGGAAVVAGAPPA
jgi:UDP-3-O-[3-hydroxymyristoyl] glucosamine N-acyltransferase